MPGRRRAGIWAVLVIGSGRLLVEGTKYLVGRARPPVDTHLVSVTTAAFPSSHSAGTTLTILALLAAFRAPWPAWLAGGLWILSIGLSRIMLGVHWPSDVLAGWGIGLTWIAIFYFSNAAGRATFSADEPLRQRD
jgi:undecaprenyl-diphosphatase